MAKRLTLRDIHEAAHRFRNWGRWGQDDELGTLNFVTPENIVAAARLVRRGKVFSLAMAFDSKGPQKGGLGRFNPVHTMLATGTDAAAGKQDALKVRYADDVITMPLQCATQWDGLSHVFYQDRMWNGYDCRLVGSSGAERNGIEKTKDRMVGRGILLDVARVKGQTALPPGYGITPDDLDETARSHNVEVRRGDFVLVRTGQMGERLRAGDWGDYAGGEAPGLAFSTLEWIHSREIAAVATDTWGVEVRPNETDEAYQPWHWVAIPNIGLTVGEMFYLEELGEDCARDGVYEFFFVAPPLPITGAVGSPVNPLAVK